jgi:hypothetical protein
LALSELVRPGRWRRPCRGLRRRPERRLRGLQALHDADHHRPAPLELGLEVGWVIFTAVGLRSVAKLKAGFCALIRPAK